MFTDAEITFACAGLVFIVAAAFALRAERCLRDAQRLGRQFKRSNENTARALDLYARGNVDAAQAIMDAEVARWNADDLEEVR